MVILANILSMASVVIQVVIMAGSERGAEINLKQKLRLSAESFVLKLIAYIIENRIGMWEDSKVGLIASTLYLLVLFIQLDIYAMLAFFLWQENITPEDVEFVVYQIGADGRATRVFRPSVEWDNYAPFGKPYPGATEPRETGAVVYGREPEDYDFTEGTDAGDAEVAKTD